MNNRVQMTFNTHWVRKKYFSENLSKKKKKRSSVGTKPRSLEWYLSALPTSPYALTVQQYLVQNV
jgi:hypothetical protein